jgi:hypothetical protein
MKFLDTLSKCPFSFACVARANGLFVFLWALCAGNKEPQLNENNDYREQRMIDVAVESNILCSNIYIVNSSFLLI